MQYSFGKTVVVALGGSVLYPDVIDIQFLRNFKKFVYSLTSHGERFVFAVGGGSVARTYIEAAAKVTKLTDEDKDWLGIHATRTNAHLVRAIFKEVANPVVIDTRGKIGKLTYPVTVASGWHPGWSTDYVAMALAEDFRVPEVIIAGKPAYVCDKDPREYKNAKPFHEISWKEYRKLIPKKWSPGSHAPVDPIAARLGEKAGINAVIVNGRHMKNFKNLILGKEFEGTIIS